MAKRRCISNDIYYKDTFIDMSDKAKVLYAYLMLNTDDYGFIENPKTILRICNASDNEFQELLENNYILALDNSVYVIKHWYAQNRIPPSKCTDKETGEPNTLYQSELSQLIVNERKEYEIRQNADNLSENCQPNITEDNITEDNSTKPKKTKNKKTLLNKTAADKVSDDAAYLQEFDKIRINKGVTI